MANILEIRDLVVSYGGIEAVKGISLDVPEGKIVTLIGANGAGKSTTLKAIAGLVRPKSASITFLGESLTGKPSDQIVAKGVTLVPEGRRVFPNLTVLENLKIGAYLRKDDLKADIDRIYELFPRLKERAWQQAGTLSGGNQQKVIIAREITNNSELLIAVNPTRGLDVGAIEFVHRYLVEQRNKNKAVLLVSFELDEIMSLSDRIEVIFDGHISGSVAGKDADENELGLMMAGGAVRG